MYFQIVCEPSNQLEPFIQFLIVNMQKYVRDLSIYDQKNVQIWNDYFSANKNFNKSPTVKDILIGFTQNLTYRQDYEGYSIYCDDTEKYEDSNYNYYQLAAIINYGTLDCKAYQIVDQMFNYFSNNIDNLYQLWRLTSNVNQTV